VSLGQVIWPYWVTGFGCAAWSGRLLGRGARLAGRLELREGRSRWGHCHLHDVADPAWRRSRPSWPVKSP